jgi:hypothetical protein
MVEATEEYWLAKVKSLELRISELEMALDFERSKSVSNA